MRLGLLVGGRNSLQVPQLQLQFDTDSDGVCFTLCTVYFLFLID